MIDMMLSGRLYRGAEAVSVGLCQYMVDDPAAHALQIARKAAQNPPLSNFAICFLCLCSEVCHTALCSMNRCTAEVLSVDVLARYGLHYLRTCEEHV